MADMKKVYDDLIITNLYLLVSKNVLTYCEKKLFQTKEKD